MSMSKLKLLGGLFFITGLVVFKTNFNFIQNQTYAMQYGINNNGENAVNFIQNLPERGFENLVRAGYYSAKGNDYEFDFLRKDDIEILPNYYEQDKIDLFVKLKKEGENEEKLFLINRYSIYDKRFDVNFSQNNNLGSNGITEVVSETISIIKQNVKKVKKFEITEEMLSEAVQFAKKNNEKINDLQLPEIISLDGDVCRSKKNNGDVVFTLKITDQDHKGEDKFVFRYLCSWSEKNKAFFIDDSYPEESFD